MKWGRLYGAEYVNKLYAMVRRHTSGPLRFVCFTDDPAGVAPAVECMACPSIDIPGPFNLLGWRKLSLFRLESFGLSGDWLYLDLDVVVTADLDDFFSFAPQRGFVVMQNWTQPGKGIGNTSVFRFRADAHARLADVLESDAQTVLASYRNSQTYVSRNIGDMVFWPDPWCVLFKTHCVPAWPQRFWRAPGLPVDARVVAFPGVPNPHQAVVGEWPARGYKRLYKFIRPAAWIAEHWQH